MKYYSKEFRLYVTGLLTGYGKMIEQSLAVSQDSNYHLFANDVKKQIDEALKILKPTAFNSTDKSFQKLQEDTEEYLRKMENDYQKKEEALRKTLEEQYQEKLRAAAIEQEKEIRKKLLQDFEQEKKTMVSAALLPEILQKFLSDNGYISEIKTETAAEEVPDTDDDFDDMPAPEPLE